MAEIDQSLTKLEQPDEHEYQPDNIHTNEEEYQPDTLHTNEEEYQPDNIHTNEEEYQPDDIHTNEEEYQPDNIHTNENEYQPVIEHENEQAALNDLPHIHETEEDKHDPEDGMTENFHPDEEQDLANETAPGDLDGGGKRWQGWPGESVFRMLVPAQKVGSVIDRKGEYIKKACEETKARIKILDGPPGTRERAVMVSAKEEPTAPLPLAIDGLLRVHKRVVDGLENDSSHPPSVVGGKVSTRLLVPASQAGSLIGKQGTTVKSIQEESNCIVRVLGKEELPTFALQDDRIVEVVGEPTGLHKAIELIASHLRKFLVDRSIMPIIEMQMQMPNSHMEQMPPSQPGVPPPQSFPPNPPGGRGHGSNPHFMPPRQFDNHYPSSDMPPPSEKPHQGISAYGREAPMHSLSSQPAPSIFTQPLQKTLNDYKVLRFLLRREEYDKSLLEEFYDYDKHNANIIGNSSRFEDAEVLLSVTVIFLSGLDILHATHSIPELQRRQAYLRGGLAALVRNVALPILFSGYTKSVMIVGGNLNSAMEAFTQWRELKAILAEERKLAEEQKAILRTQESLQQELKLEAKQAEQTILRKQGVLEKASFRRWANEWANDNGTMATMHQKMVRRAAVGRGNQ